MQLTDFFVKGYYSDILNTDILAEFDNYKFVNCQENSSMHITDVIQKKLDDLHLYLAETYVSKVFSSYRLLNNGMWDNVDSGSSEWHNDPKDPLFTDIGLRTYKYSKSRNFFDRFKTKWIRLKTSYHRRVSKLKLILDL